MGLPKYIVNIKELADLLKNGVDLQANVVTGDLQSLLKNYFDELLSLLRQILEGKEAQPQRSVSLHSYIPALAFDYELVHVFKEDVYITGITYSQTGWKVMDCWSLYIDEELLFDGVATKELGEYKHFNGFYGVNAGAAIKVIHHNNSGNSKQVWFDIGYIKRPVNTVETGKEINIIIRPEEIKEIGYIEISEGAADPLIITMNFDVLSGAQFPDLEVLAPNGISFGYTRDYLKGPNSETINGLNCCSSAKYSGYTSNPEQMIFEKPITGKWYFYGQSVGGTLDSAVSFTCNYPVKLTYSPF